ncbi:MAG TPA: hypothetical protein VG028_02775 [Terriglobia bacterium]|nr:hypothetical protein [Terriglobia bacterium]
MKPQQLSHGVALLTAVGVTLLGAMTLAAAEDATKPAAPPFSIAQGGKPGNAPKDVTASLSMDKTILAQQAQIEELTRRVEQLENRLEAITAPTHVSQSGLVSSLVPVIPSGFDTYAGDPAPGLQSATDSLPASQEQVTDVSNKVDQINESLETLNQGVAGFKFSGDLRFRYDGLFRSGNSIAGPLQDSRERYRLRFNVNKTLDDHFDFHLQLGSGTYTSQQSIDSDFSGLGAHGPIFISEYSARYHNRLFDIRGGKMEEVFADGSRFFFDHNIRFNGFQESANLPFESKPLGMTNLELRAGEYILTNPNVQTLSASSAFVGSGYAPGQKVRDADLFHTGVAVFGRISEGWSHQFFADFQWYRNANQIQLASTAAGFPLLLNDYYGLPLSAGLGQTGNATTTPVGTIYTARGFLIPHLSYRIGHLGWRTHHQNVPVWLQFDAARNIGASFQRDAWMGTLNVGEVKKFGDLRFLYIYSEKEANSMIAQVTDAGLGTISGVNIRSQNFRVDLGLTNFLQWQNLLFIQNEISSNDPARNFYVPLPRGANTQYRVQSQFQFTF